MGIVTKLEHEQLISFSNQYDCKWLIFECIGSRNKFDSHLGHLRSLPKESILVVIPMQAQNVGYGEQPSVPEATKVAPEKVATVG